MLLFSASYDDTIKIWKEDNDDWVCIQTLVGHTSTVWGLALHQDGQRFVSCSDDRSIIIWELQVDDKGGRWLIVGSLKGVHTQPIYR